MRACLRDSKEDVKALRREDAALRTQNAALHTADAPRSSTAAKSTRSSEVALRTCEHEIARLQRELAAVEKRSTALLAADAERCSSGMHTVHSAGQAHTLTGPSLRQYGSNVQCYASGTLFTGPRLVHARNELHEHADQCGRCQATILLAEHRAHHNRIHLRLQGLLLCVTQAARSPSAHAQRTAATAR